MLTARVIGQSVSEFAAEIRLCRLLVKAMMKTLRGRQWGHEMGILDSRIAGPLAVAAVYWLVSGSLFVPRSAARADSSLTRRDSKLQPFARDAVLARFDRNRDGKLDVREITALRAAFGGIDVPMLPTKVLSYSRVTLPSYIPSTALRVVDNTPADNGLTNAGATLGRVLFYDRQLSRNNTVACALCHVQKAGFSDPRRFSIGFQGKRTSRNSMGLANIRYTNLKGERPGFFWDERAATLEEQALLPVQDKLEMGMKLKDLESRLQKLPYYPPLFAAAFGSKTVTSQRIAQALAQFMRSLTSFDSKFDRGAAASKNGDLSAEFTNFTPQENLGKSLFIDGLGGITETGCAMCHVPPTFNMHKAFNIGLDAKSKDPGLGALGRKSNDLFTPSNAGKFKAPSLRNIALTAPYMHDGRFQSLDQVVEHYSARVHPHKNLGLAVEPDKTGKPTSGLRFSKKQKAALVAFLKTLTDRRLVSDSRFSDPFIRAVGSGPAGQRSGKTQQSSAPAAERFKSLVKEYEQDGRSRALARKFLDLAMNHPRDPVAVDALIWVASNMRTGAELTQSLQALSKKHIKNAKLAGLCKRLVRKPGAASEKLLRELLKHTPHKSVRAQATFYLAEFLQRQIKLVATLKAEPDQAKRIDQFYGRGFSKRLLSLDTAKVSGEVEQLYVRIVKSHAGVKVGEATMGAIAKNSLFALRHLSIGKRAPEITGKDVSGKPFKLSDYRGKIVLLDFWGDW